MSECEVASRGGQAPEYDGATAAGGSSRRVVTLALLLAMTVAALEQTVVSTAMPTIIAKLKGVDIYPWVFSAYLLASTVTTPLYGKLADFLGRKRVLLFGLGLFSLGSILSGCAQSMPALIAMRVIQGLGAGALGPIIVTMLGDLYTLKQRAEVQGLFSAVWGVSSVVGPAVGGVLTDNLSWRWVFFVTVPFSLVAAWILVRHVHEKLEQRRVEPIDWLGAALLASSSTVILLALLGGADRSWATITALLGLGAALLVLLVWQERRAADPVLPVDLLVQPAFAAAIAGSFLIGGLLFGIDTYVPLYVQGVLGGSATVAGRMITPLFLAWSLSVAVAAKVVIRLGFRTTSMVGSVLIAAGSCALVLGSRDPAWAGPVFAVAMGVIGLGLGPTALCYILGVQNSVDWDRRGMATGSVVFFRSIGGAWCVGLLGAALGYGLAHDLDRSVAAGIDVSKALRPETHDQLTPEQLKLVQAALCKALGNVFLQILVMAALGILCSSRLARGRAVQRGEIAPAPPQDDGLALAAAAEP